MGDFKRVHSTFTQFCVDTFGEKWGEDVRDFYRDCVKFRNPRKKTKQRLATPTEQRRENIKDILKNHSMEDIVKAMDIVKYKQSMYLIDKPVFIEYFLTIIENGPRSTYTSTTLFTYKPVDKPTVVPVPKEKITTRNKDEFYNWNYTCPSCSTTLTWKMSECPSCKKELVWESLWSMKG